jgi:hypothetical protein
MAVPSTTRSIRTRRRTQTIYGARGSRRDPRAGAMASTRVGRGRFGAWCGLGSRGQPCLSLGRRSAPSGAGLLGCAYWTCRVSSGVTRRARLGAGCLSGLRTPGGLSGRRAADVGRMQRANAVRSEESRFSGAITATLHSLARRVAAKCKRSRHLREHARGGSTVLAADPLRWDDASDAGSGGTAHHMKRCPMGDQAERSAPPARTEGSQAARHDYPRRRHATPPRRSRTPRWVRLSFSSTASRQEVEVESLESRRKELRSHGLPFIPWRLSTRETHASVHDRRATSVPVNSVSVARWDQPI